MKGRGCGAGCTSCRSFANRGLVHMIAGTTCRGACHGGAAQITSGRPGGDGVGKTGDGHVHSHGGILRLRKLNCAPGRAPAAVSTLGTDNAPVSRLGHVLQRSEATQLELLRRVGVGADDTALRRQRAALYRGSLNKLWSCEMYAACDASARDGRLLATEHQMWATVYCELTDPNAFPPFLGNADCEPQAWDWLSI
eukprot:366436-Chlamydomonas_euryale.AAC.9